jgi:hypothetical protein
MKREGRYLDSDDFSSDQDGYWNGFGGQSALNFRPKMGQEALLKNYAKVATTVFDERSYFQRCENFLSRYVPSRDSYREKRYLEYGLAFMRFVKMVMFTRYNAELLWFLLRVGRKHPRKLAEALILGVGGYSLIIEREEIKRVFNM